jgi:hypothetical protein
MDPITKEAIDSLLEGKKKYRSFAEKVYESSKGAYTSPRPRERTYETYEEHRAKADLLNKRPTHCFDEGEKSMDLKQEIATLSIDTASASIVFKAPITDFLINRIELAVPLTQREWLADKRAWRFSSAALPIIKPILKDTYKEVQLLGVPKAIPATKFDQLMTKLTKDDKAQLYRVLASKYHPDKGGSHEVMTLINVVFRS